MIVGPVDRRQPSSGSPVQCRHGPPTAYSSLTLTEHFRGERAGGLSGFLPGYAEREASIIAAVAIACALSSTSYRIATFVSHDLAR